MNTQRLKRGYDSLDEAIAEARPRASTQYRTQYVYLVAGRHVISAIEHPGALAKVRYDGTIERAQGEEQKA